MTTGANGQVVEEEWTCTRCPPNSQSLCGSTLSTDCKCNPGFTGGDGLTCYPCPLNTYKALVPPRPPPLPLMTPPPATGRLAGSARCWRDHVRELDEWRGEGGR
jgi:hypothetical protein